MQHPSTVRSAWNGLAMKGAFFVILVACALVAGPRFAQAADSLGPDAPTEEVAAKKASVLDAVKRGKTLLQEEVARRRAEGKAEQTVDSQPVWADVTLAVWERDTGVISLVQIMKSGRKIKVLTPGDWQVRVAYDAKINSQYALPPEKNAVIVGVRYPHAIGRQVTKKKKVYDVADTIRVPYSSAFFVPEVLAGGSDYLSYLVQDAFDELRERGVKSRAFPGKLVVDVIDPYLIKSIVVIEHTDHASLTREDDPERTLGIFLAKLALNGDDAFDGTASNAGAVGLAQFIPSTYALYVKNRPDLALIPDFQAGMNDHKNAVKAEVAYLDASLAELPQAIRTIYAGDKNKAAAFLAASYNGGSTRVRRAYAAYGDDWASYHGARKTSLRKETVQYVQKLTATYGMFTAGVFATPAAPSGALPKQVIATIAQATVPAGSICFSDGGCAIR